MIKDNDTGNNHTLSGEGIKLGWELANTCVGLAKTLAPYDTGNLAEAIRLDYSGNIDEKFTVKYPFREVNYLYALEFGSTRSTKNVGFIRNQTVPIMVSMIEAYFEQKMDYTDFIQSTTFTNIAAKKGVGDTMHKRVNVGFTRYKFAETKTRLQRRLASVSAYNKMFYYNTDKRNKTYVHGNFEYNPDTGKKV